MKFGKILRIENIKNAEALFADVSGKGFESCQLVYKPERYEVSDAKLIKELAEKYSLEISAMFCGFRDKEWVWDIYYGYLTAGINIEGFRKSRLDYVMAAADFASVIGIEDIIVHAGFVPNNPFAPEYATMLSSVFVLGSYLKKNRQNLLFETGGESPITLLRLIQDVKLDNLYVNLDPANIIMYGYGNPVDAIDVFGKYVRNIHGKDGCVPTDPRQIGRETVIGQGMVDFPKMLQKLKALGYDRYITIERETGSTPEDDILLAREYLENIWNSI